MGMFNINITGVGSNGCDRKTGAGQKLHHRCGRFNCPDCAAFEFTQRLRQMGVFNTQAGKAEFTHWPGAQDEVVDDMLRNERKSGQF